MPALARVNGTSYALTDASVRVLDHGFLYGNGLFETMRAFDGYIFGLEAHLLRLVEAAKAIGLPAPTAGHLEGEVRIALEDAGIFDAYVRLTVTRGVGAPGPDPTSCDKPTVVVVVRPCPPQREHWFTEGITTVTASIRRNTFSPLTRVKSTNYMECILAKETAKAAGAEEAIFLDTEGFLAEATAWNLFWVKDEMLYTPHEDGAILPGITRAVVLVLAYKGGIPYERGLYEPEVLFDADEVFLTNSLYGIVPIGSFDGDRIGQSFPGEMTARFGVTYVENIEKNSGVEMRKDNA